MIHFQSRSSFKINSNHVHTLIITSAWKFKPNFLWTPGSYNQTVFECQRGFYGQMLKHPVLNSCLLYTLVFQNWPDREAYKYVQKSSNIRKKVYNFIFPLFGLTLGLYR